MLESKPRLLSCNSIRVPFWHEIPEPLEDPALLTFPCGEHLDAAGSDRINPADKHYVIPLAACRQRSTDRRAWLWFAPHECAQSLLYFASLSWRERSCLPFRTAAWAGVSGRAMSINSCSRNMVREPTFTRVSLPWLSHARIVHGLRPPRNSAALSIE